MQSYFGESPDSRSRERLNISLKQMKHTYVQCIVSFGNLLLQEELQAVCSHKRITNSEASDLYIENKKKR